MNNHEHHWEPFAIVRDNSYSQRTYLVQSCDCGAARQISVPSFEVYDEGHPDYEAPTDGE